VLSVINEEISTNEIHTSFERPKNLEPLYLKILRNIGLRPYGIFPQDPNIFKPTHLAKRIGVDPKPHKAHLAGMEKTGVIRFYEVYPNFRHLGIEASAYLLRSDDEDR